MGAAAGDGTGTVVAGLRVASGPDAADLGTFLARASRLDPAALVRLRSAAGRTTGYVRLPFGVLVSRSAAADGPADRTVRCADLVAALAGVDGAATVSLPPARDVEWRGQLPPATGWRRLDTVPAGVVRHLVRAGADTLRATPGADGDSLLDHESLTVSAGDVSVALPLRVLSALWRMGFLGPSWPPAGVGNDVGTAHGGGGGGVRGGGGGAGEGPAATTAPSQQAPSQQAPSGSMPSVPAPTGSASTAGPDAVPAAPGGAVPTRDAVVVSTAGGWVRLAAAFGTAYHHLAAANPGGLIPRR